MLDPSSRLYVATLLLMFVAGLMVGFAAGYHSGAVLKEDGGIDAVKAEVFAAYYVEVPAG
jgi:hypothetical protein